MPLFDNYIPTQAFARSGSLAAAWGSQMPTRDWVRLRQPFLDDSGRACVTIADLDKGFTRNDAKSGEKKPLLRTYLIQDLLNRGYPVPLTANATTLHMDAWLEL